MWEYWEQEHQQGFKTKIVSCDLAAQGEQLA